MRLFSIILFLCFVYPVWANDKPELMLLKTYKKVDFQQGQWVWSEKYDGVRAYWDGQHLLSRSGKIYFAPKWFIEQLPPFPIDGELWLARGAFQQTVSIVRKKRSDKGWKRIHYMIFEVPNQKGGLFERLAVLHDFLKKSPSSVVRIITQYPINSDQEVRQHLKAVVDSGGEGIVIRRADIPYRVGRLKTALKVKPFFDTECIVTGYTEGKGKYEGMVGALKCRLENGKIFSLGSGLLDKQRMNPPKIGQKVSFKYMGWTQRGMPRHPVFLRIRPQE